MDLLLERIAKKEKYTIGKLYIDGEYFCDVIEDKDRGLYSYMNVGEISRLKVYGETAIPYGTYKVRLSMSPKYKKILPEIMNVPGWTGVRIHSGNYANYETFLKSIDIPLGKEILNEDECIEVV